MEQIAINAFQAWATGERSGDYAAFKTLLSTNFRSYSHPISPKRGQYSGTNARAMMLELIAGREKQPNHLEFSNVIRTRNENTFVFLFDSKGEVAGGYPYQGFNAVAFTIEDDQVIGFREYFGDVDPAWFGN
jgi:hypothetical protein